MKDLGYSLVRRYSSPASHSLDISYDLNFFIDTWVYGDEFFQGLDAVTGYCLPSYAGGSGVYFCPSYRVVNFLFPFSLGSVYVEFRK